MSSGESILARAKSTIDTTGFREQSWTGTFAQYVDVVRREPRVTRTAFERIYDMILGQGVREYVDNRKKIVHYDFFDDVAHAGEDAIYGLDIPLMKLVNIFKSAAQRYGTERRVILLHGPGRVVKSTIARLRRRGSRRIRDARRRLYTWRVRDSTSDEVVLCPMHEEPLHLVPRSCANRAARDQRGVAGRLSGRIEGDPCPFCRQEFRDLMTKYGATGRAC
jgi:serine protein kinase